MVSFLKKLSKSNQGSQIFPYFFDDDQPDPAATKFWSSGQILIEDQKNTTVGFSFFTKSKKKSGDVKSRYMFLYKHHLISAKVIKFASLYVNIV